MKPHHHSLYTAIITPMRDDGNIDFISFKNLLEIQQKADCGVVILGSTGESLAIDDKEKRQIVHFVMALNLSIPVIVGVGGYQLQQQLDWIDFCNSYHISGYLLVTPLYAKPGTKGQSQWFEALLDASDKPCMLYNVPSRTGIHLSDETLSALKHHPRLWALKEASGDIDRSKCRAVLLKFSIYYFLERFV
ncbi:MAG: dihydrodipicolinate synthase family protein, partial [Francisellaceae bacterium]